jgi:hypothetical protein
MKEEYIKKIDILLESLRAHMNLLIYELKAGIDDYAREQYKRIEEDIDEIGGTLKKGLEDKTPEKKEEKQD